MVLEHQRNHIQRQWIARSVAEDLNQRIQYWSIGQTVVMVTVAMVQIFVFRRLFSARDYVRSTSSRT